MSIRWNISVEDAELVWAIVDKAVAHNREFAGKNARTLTMDLTAVHLNGNPLRLADMAKAPFTDIAHDIYGITRHIDRNTGQLLDFFSPRFSAPEASTPEVTR